MCVECKNSAWCIIRTQEFAAATVVIITVIIIIIMVILGGPETIKETLLFVSNFHVLSSPQLWPEGKV